MEAEERTKSEKSQRSTRPMISETNLHLLRSPLSLILLTTATDLHRHFHDKLLVLHPDQPPTQHNSAQDPRFPLARSLAKTSARPEARA